MHDARVKVATEPGQEGRRVWYCSCGAFDFTPRSYREAAESAREHVREARANERKP